MIFLTTKMKQPFDLKHRKALRDGVIAKMKALIFEIWTRKRLEFEIVPRIVIMTGVGDR